jgi:hypothetical protein
MRARLRRTGASANEGRRWGPGARTGGARPAPRRRRRRRRGGRACCRRRRSRRGPVAFLGLAARLPAGVRPEWRQQPVLGRLGWRCPPRRVECSVPARGAARVGVPAVSLTSLL